MLVADEKLRFGPFDLDPRRRLLTGPDGPVSLGGRAFDLLAVLAGAQGRLFTRHELIELVWPGLVVEENNLHVQMVALRKTLGGWQKLVQTVPGRGYRLVSDAPTGVETPPQSGLPEAQLAAHPGFMRPPLIGRDQELAELRKRLARHRLVTITGPSGIGKTHLALGLADMVLDDFSGLVRIADFAPITEDTRVEATVIAAFGLRLSESASRPEALAQALGARRALLILDNCEHRLGGIAPLAGALLTACPSLSVIATSQEPLRVESEAAYRLTPLALPPPKATAPEEVAGYGAVELFLQRVEAADRHFRLGGSNSATVAAICRSLDGIPLALEMAAARVPSLGLEGLHSRLDKRLRLLTAGLSTAAARHRTLRATIAWSDELLDETDRRVFHRLGVFAGTFSAEAAAAILKDGEEDEWTILDALGRLVDKSLVVAEAGAEPRYRLLETPRLFALEQLTAAGGHAACLRRHAVFYASLLEQAYAEWETIQDDPWLARFAPELGNVRAALDWAVSPQGDAELAASLAGAAATLFDKSSLLTEGRRYLERADAAAPDASVASRARLFRQTGSLWFSSDRPRALAALERAAEMYLALGDDKERGAALALAGVIHSFLGSRDQAKTLLNQAKDLLAGATRPKTSFYVLNNLGIIAGMEEDFFSARGFFDQALRLARRGSAGQSQVTALINLAEIEFNLGEIDLAIERVGTAISFLRAEAQQTNLSWALVNIATYLLIAGRLAEARHAATEALSLVALQGGFILRVCLQQCALLGASAGNMKDAARLLGFVDAGYEAAGELREPTEERVYEVLSQRLRSGLSPAAFQQLTDEGAAWNEAAAAKAAAKLLALGDEAGEI